MSDLALQTLAWISGSLNDYDVTLYDVPYTQIQSTTLCRLPYTIYFVLAPHRAPNVTGDPSRSHSIPCLMQS